MLFLMKFPSYHECPSRGMPDGQARSCIDYKGKTAYKILKKLL